MENTPPDQQRLQVSRENSWEAAALLTPLDETSHDNVPGCEQARPGTLRREPTRSSIASDRLEPALTSHQSTEQPTDKTPPSGRTPPNPVGRLLHAAWISESTACFFSFACIGAVIGVLFYEDGTELDHWNLAIPPNAVVAFIALLAKSSCLMAITEIISQLKWRHYATTPQPLIDFELFDAASRGPFGSAVLLFRKHHHAILASCAALLTITALLFDPFIQLAIRFPGKPFPISSMSSEFRAAHAYDPQGSLVTSHNLNSVG